MWFICLNKVRPDLCAVDCSTPPSDFLGKFWTDSLVHDQSALNLLVDIIGENNVILGSDYPFVLGELNTGNLIENSKYSEELREKLLYKNGMKFLGCDI